MCAPAPASRRRRTCKGKRVGTSQYSSTGLVLHARHAAARLRRQVRGHALVHGRAQHASSSRRSFRSTCRRRSSSTFSPAGRRSRRCSRRASSMRCCRSTSRSSSSTARRDRAAVPELQGGRARLLPRAPRSFRSCTPWWCARTCIASIRGSRRASTRRSARPRRSRSTASTTPMRCASRCLG